MNQEELRREVVQQFFNGGVLLQLRDRLGGQRRKGGKHLVWCEVIRDMRVRGGQRALRSGRLRPVRSGYQGIGNRQDSAYIQCRMN